MLEYQIGEAKMFIKLMKAGQIFGLSLVIAMHMVGNARAASGNVLADIQEAGIENPQELIFFENLTKYSPDGNYRVRVSALNDDMEGATIWSENADGSNSQPLVACNEDCWVTNPIWAWDSAQIAYLKVFDIYLDGTGTVPRFELWTINLDGTANSLLTDTPNLNPSLGFGGKADLTWTLANEIEFFDHKASPIKKYAIQPETLEIREIEISGIGDSVSAAASKFSKLSPGNETQIPGVRLADGSLTVQLFWEDAGININNDRYEYCIDQSNNNQCNNTWVERKSLYSGLGDITLQAMQTYYWQVRTQNDEKYANAGNWWSFKVVPVNPSVKSITRVNPTPTSASSVNFTVTFSHSVTGVDGSDFVLTATGNMVGVSIINMGGSGATYIVTANISSGSGTLRLDLVDNDSIVDVSNLPLGGSGAGNGSFARGEIYTIDRTAPTVVSSAAVPGSWNLLYDHYFQVRFSEPVTGVDTSAPFGDFTLTTTGSIVGASITSVSGTGTTYTVAVKPGSGEGTIRLDVVNNGTIKDGLGNPLGGSFTSGVPYPIYKNIETYIGGSLKGAYGVGSSQSISDSYQGVNNGPARITGTSDLITAMRVIWGTGYDEMMGYPADQLTNEYLFPWYNNTAMRSQLRIGNTGAVPADVYIYIGGILQNPNGVAYTLPVGGSIRQEYTGVNNGPVRVVTNTSGASILATMRVIWGTGYDEMMGYPADQLTNEYLFPWYNNTAMRSQLRIGNTGAVPADVYIYIGGILQNPNGVAYTLPVGGSIRQEYTGVNNGPVRVVTNTSGATILATMRVIWGAGYDELMGYPADQLTNEYLFPWYNNVAYNNKTMSSQLRIANTGSVPAVVDVYIGGVKIYTDTIPVGGSERPEYAGVVNGPVRVVTNTSGATILATMRVTWGTAGYNEVIGFPADQLTTEYLFPWYNNSAMVSEFSIAVP
jgi:hypothetical protein